jgi:hypothetical protein
MPFKTQDQMRQYQANWMWRRRAAWIVENGPCNWCGNRQDLRVVYKDPTDKVIRVPAIWSRRDEVRKELLALCVVLCSDCAKQKRRDERRATT